MNTVLVAFPSGHFNFIRAATPPFLCELEKVTILLTILQVVAYWIVLVVEGRVAMVFKSLMGFRLFKVSSPDSIKGCSVLQVTQYF
jgi:hypothetical protein